MNKLRKILLSEHTWKGEGWLLKNEEFNAKWAILVDDIIPELEKLRDVYKERSKTQTGLVLIKSELNRLIRKIKGVQ
jgi:hypothetical protein